MTILPDLQGLEDKIIEVNAKFNKINIENGLTPHYGIRSVMKFHKGSGSFKIRTLWKEWNSNQGYGSTLTMKGLGIYIKYQENYFLKGFNEASKLGELQTNVKVNKAIQAQDKSEFDARITLNHKKRAQAWKRDSSGGEPRFNDLEAFVNQMLSGIDLQEREEKSDGKGSVKRLCRNRKEKI